MIQRRRPQTIPFDVLERAASAFRVLAHPHRLRIVELLEVETLAVGALANLLAIPQAACSQHLNLMRAHGLLRGRRDGRSVRYEIVHPAARNILECIRTHGA